MIRDPGLPPALRKGCLNMTHWTWPHNQAPNPLALTNRDANMLLGPGPLARTSQRVSQHAPLDMAYNPDSKLPCPDLSQRKEDDPPLIFGN